MIGESSALLSKTVDELVRAHRSRIILNFRDVSAIDSAGVGALLAAYALIKHSKGQLKLLNPPQKVRDVLKLTQLSKVFEVYADEESALRSFAEV